MRGIVRRGKPCSVNPYGAASVRRVKGIYGGSPCAPRSPRSCTSWPNWSRTCAGRGIPDSLDLFESVDPELWRACNGDPGRMLGEVCAERIEKLARDRKFLRRLADVARRPHRLPDPAALVPAAAGRRASHCRPRSATSRPSSASPRCCRSTPAASASWPATTSRPPATSACRSSASACCTARATSGSRCRPTAGSSSTTRPSTRGGLPISALKDADGAPVRISLRAARGPHAARAGVGGRGRPGAAAAARQRHRGERHRRAPGHRPALRRRPRAPPASRSCCSASAASARSAPTARRPARPRPRCSTPTRATPASSASSASASSSRTTG